MDILLAILKAAGIWEGLFSYTLKDRARYDTNFAVLRSGHIHSSGIFGWNDDFSCISRESVALFSIVVAPFTHTQQYFHINRVESLLLLRDHSDFYSPPAGSLPEVVFCCYFCCFVRQLLCYWTVNPSRSLVPWFLLCLLSTTLGSYSASGKTSQEGGKCH